MEMCSGEGKPQRAILKTSYSQWLPSMPFTSVAIGIVYLAVAVFVWFFNVKLLLFIPPFSITVSFGNKKLHTNLNLSLGS